ncbi:MAG: response regulator [Rhodohalobacter sp.]|nr:response regulator [Rhodohalobacter sp.]
MEAITNTYQFYLLNEIWLYSLTNQIYLITLLMVFSLVAYLFIKNRKMDSFTLTTNEQHHFLQAVTKYSDTADFILDQNNVLKFANDHFLELFNLDEESVDNQTFSDINIPDNLKSFVLNSNSITQKKDAELTFNNHRVTCRRAPVTTHDGQLLGSLFKISDHVLTGKGKKEKRDWLHEINTPLNAIVGYSEILKNQEDISEENREYLETINTQSFELRTKIQNLLSDQDSGNVNSSQQKKEIKHVMIVDDVPINRTVLKIMLKRMGYEVSEAVNGQEALNKFENQTVDLILMDISMPVMDGLEAAKKLRKNGYSLENLPIVAVTASSFYNNKETLHSKGFNALLRKPFKEKDLTDILYTVSAKLN